MEEKNINKKSNLSGWHHNTHLGVNVKTVLNSDRIMRVGKDYQGVLKRDASTSPSWKRCLGA